MTPEAQAWHQQQMDLLTAREDWAGLLRHYIAHQHEDALEAARNLLLRRSEAPWPAVVSVLERFRSEDILDEVTRLVPLITGHDEGTTLRLLGVWRRAAQCQTIDKTHADPEVLAELPIAMAAAQQAIRFASELGDRALEAALLMFQIAGHRAQGDLSAALDAQLRTVEIYRELTEANPRVFTPDLARSLSNLAVRLSDLGRREDALVAAQEAVTLRRALAQANPQTFTPGLAISLTNLAIRLSKLGQREDALAAAQEAVEFYRTLAKANPQAFAPALAKSLNNFAIQLSDLGRREDALAAAQEAVEFYRALNQTNPQALIADLAMSLSNLAIHLSEVGRREHALTPSQEAVELHRKLAKANPQVFSSDLARSLNTLANRLSDLGRREDALAPSQEAVELYRALAEANPHAFAQDLARSLSDFAIQLSDLGRREDALAPAQEAVNLRRALARTNPQAFTQDLAMSLNNLAVLLGDLGRREDALATAQEAVKIYRSLAKANPQAFASELAMSLNNLANGFSELGRQKDALSPAKEAVKLRRALAKANPQAFTPDLARSLNTLANRLSDLGRRKDALSPAREAVRLRQVLAKANPRAFAPDLAMALNNLAVLLGHLGRDEEELVHLNQASKLYDFLATRTPAAFVEGRLRAHANLGQCLRKLPTRSGRPDYRAAWEAFGKAIDCAELFRGLFRDEAQRQRVLHEATFAFVGRVQTGLDLWQTEHNTHALAEALHAAERVRSRRLLDLLDHETIEPRGPDDLRARWRQLRERLQRARLALREAEEAQPSPEGAVPSTTSPSSTRMLRIADTELRTTWNPEQRAQARRDVAELEQHEAALLAEIQPHDPEFDPNRPVPPLTLERFRELQGQDSGPGLVNWFLGSDEGCAFVLLPGEPLFAVRLPGLGRGQAAQLASQWYDGYRPANEEQAKRWQEDQSLKQAEFARWANAMPERLRCVAKVALWPVLREIDDRLAASGKELTRLVLCPHELLNVFPLHAAPMPEGEGVTTDRWEVTYTPSLSLLHRVAGRSRPQGGALMVGNPTLDLLFTELESALFSGRYRDARNLYGSRATAEALLSEAVDKALLQISSHMTAGGGDARRAGLVLAEKHVLRLPALYARLKLARGGRVLLNGCESGLLLRGPDGSLDYEGLPMAFLFAGARTVVSTLFSVSDISSALLITRFHQELDRPAATVSGALRAAADWLRGKSPNGLRNGVQLLLAVEDILDRIDPKHFEHWSHRSFHELVEECQGHARLLAEQSSQYPPFASPAYWAGHVVTGHGWE